MVMGHGVRPRRFLQMLALAMISASAGCKGGGGNGGSGNPPPDTTPPTVSITSPANGASVSGTITVSANATDDVAVASVQFRVDGNNTGGPITSAPYSLQLNTATLLNGSHTLTAVAKDTSNNSATSSPVTITVNNVTGTGGMGPLVQSAANAHYFVNPAGKGVLLSGSHTWNDFLDTDQSASPAALDFNAYVNFLKSHGHNTTILWRKDLPTYCGWGAGGTWTMAPFPWQRTGGSGGTRVASDGLPAFDLTQLNQAYFDRLRARVIQLQQNGIYAIVELFDGLGLTSNRCPADGYPFTGGNNVNSVDDRGGTNSMTMGAPNTITGYQDAFVQKVIDTVNDQPNVLWEISEEAPDNSTWWQGHMISLIRSYEGGKPFQHPVGFPTLNISGGSDTTLYNSNADWVAPKARFSPTSSCGTGTPACKVNINDSDHSYFGMWNDSAQTNRNYIWENFTSGDSVIFMDPYVIYWTTGNRNLCGSPVNGVCNAVDTRWDNFRNNMGYVLTYANTKLDLLKMTPQGNLSSTGHCLADNVAAGAEYLVYAPNGGTFTVNLSTQAGRTLNIEWLDPSSGAVTNGGTVPGGSSSQPFTAPFGGDAVLYLVDTAGHN
jgi:Big-like domain-containing protein/collagenase-like protein with putative collagen-binding domain